MEEEKKDNDTNVENKEEIKKEEVIEKNVDYKDMALRAMADLDNYKKRAEEENKNFKEYLVYDIISEFLPIYNNLKQAEAFIPEDQRKIAWVVGITMILKQFREMLKVYGIEEFSVIGQKFDHETMDAVMTEKDESKEEDTILREIDCGYKLNGKIVQHAKVVVNKIN